MKEEIKCSKCNNDREYILETNQGVMIDYSRLLNGNSYDGWAEIECPKCEKRWGRWSHKLLKKGEEEDTKLRYK